MFIDFYKYQGTGNDFIIIDNRNNFFDGNNYDFISLMCERKVSVGADGLILLQNHNEFDFEMIYYNADGDTNISGIEGNINSKLGEKLFSSAAA